MFFSIVGRSPSEVAHATRDEIADLGGKNYGHNFEHFSIEW